MSESLKQKTFKGTIWSAVETFSVQGIQFIVMLIMARILTPADYGIVGMIAIFLAISGSLMNSGFSQALIRKVNRNQIDKSTVFFFNIFVGFILYGILFFSAPLISKFYNEPLLTPVTRVVGLGLVLNSLCVVQNAIYTLKLDFKTVAKASLVSTIISGLIGIILAYSNCGVWALVIQGLIANIINALLLWVYSKWRPSWVYSWSSFKEMFGFGSKLLFSGLLNTAYGNIYSLVIGKVYSASDLGYFTRANSFSTMASSNLTRILQRVTYPSLCSIQNEDSRLRNAYRRILKVSAFIIFPLMAGMAALATPLILTLLTDKWLFSAILLIPICLGGMWYPIHAINLNLLQVKGRSDLFLKLEIIKKVLGVLVLIISIPLGLYIMCWGSLISSLIALTINTYYTGKLINLGFFKQMSDLSPTLILSLSMGIVVWFTISVLPFSNPVLLLIGITEGALFYLLGAKLFRFPELDEIRSLLKRNKNEQADNSNIAVTAES